MTGQTGSCHSVLAELDSLTPPLIGPMPRECPPQRRRKPITHTSTKANEEMAR
jgi:hypothetical protein